MPKSWSFRASIATRIQSIMAGFRLSAPGFWPRSSIPPRPLQAIAAAEVACGTGVDTALSRGFTRSIHPAADRVGARLHRVEPGAAVDRLRCAEAHAAR